MLNISASGGAGVSQMRFSNDNATWSDWEPYAATRTGWNLADQTVDGTKTVYVQVRDEFGHLSTVVSDDVGLEHIAPTITAQHPQPNLAGWYNVGEVKFTLAATDGGSGVKEVWYSIDGGVQKGTTFSVSGEGKHTVAYWARTTRATRWTARKRSGSTPQPL